jgi:hypothetical protein
MAFYNSSKNTLRYVFLLFTFIIFSHGASGVDEESPEYLQWYDAAKKLQEEVDADCCVSNSEQALAYLANIHSRYTASVEERRQSEELLLSAQKLGFNMAQVVPYELFCNPILCNIRLIIKL